MIDVYEDLLHYFGRNENWGDPDKMDVTLLILLDRLRFALGSSIHINNGYATTGHSNNSEHYHGRAVDFTVPRLSFSIAVKAIIKYLDNTNLACKVGFGIYPDWKTPGFHLDVRGITARWGRVNGVYLSLDTALKTIK